MATLQAFRIGLNDVYDLAYDIAQEFERLVQFFDIDMLKPLIDKVINVLEVLENNVQRIELLEAEERNLKSNNLCLYNEKTVSDQEKCKLKQIYEESEESWVEEVRNLRSRLSALRTDNDLLKSHLIERKESCTKLDDRCDEAVNEQSEVMKRMKHLVKQKEKQLQDNVSTINALNSRIQELLKVNENLHLKNQEARTDISKLILEKNDMKNELMLHKRENVLLSECIQDFLQSNSRMLQNRENNKSIEYTFEESLTGDYQNQELFLKDKIKTLRCKLQNFRSKSNLHETSISESNSAKNKVPFSRIHQLFHLFLGAVAYSDFYWF